MKLCADTWFFVQLSKEHPKAVDVLRKVAKGKDRLIIPTAAILELTRLSIRTGKMDTLEKVLRLMDRSKYFDVIDLDVTLAKAAGKLSATHGVPTVDAIIAQTCISEKCAKVLTDDNHFDPLDKMRLLKKYSW